MKKEYMKLRPFLDIQPGKDRSVFPGNDCDCKKSSVADTPVQLFLGALNTTSLSLNVRKSFMIMAI
jgi:hypothetical protein